MKVPDDVCLHISEFSNLRDLLYFSQVSPHYRKLLPKPFENTNNLKLYLQKREHVDSDDIELTTRYLRFNNYFSPQNRMKKSKHRFSIIDGFFKVFCSGGGRNPQENLAKEKRKALEVFFAHCSLEKLRSIRCNGNLYLKTVNVYDIHEALGFGGNITALRVQINIVRYEEDAAYTLKFAAEHFPNLSRLDIVDLHPYKTDILKKETRLYSLIIR